VIAVLLPGMDGTGELFEPFVQAMPPHIEVVRVRYPGAIRLSYAQTAELVLGQLPTKRPYVIIAESYSGPIAIRLAAQNLPALRAIVLVASFCERPAGLAGNWLSGLPLETIFRLPIPNWFLRWLLMDSQTSAELIAACQSAISQVRPDVLAARMRDVLAVDCSEEVRGCPTRIVCLNAANDRLIARRGQLGFQRARPDIEMVPIAGPHLLLQCAPQAVVTKLEEMGLFR